MVRKIISLLKRPGGLTILLSKLKIRGISTHRSYGFQPWPLNADILDVHPAHLTLTHSEIAAARSFNAENEFKRRAHRSSLKIAWFMPDFETGGGGHMNIFRCQKFLQSEFGIESANVVYPGRSSSTQPAKMSQFYKHKAESSFPSVYGLTPFLQNEDELKAYSIHMATNWASVYGILKQKDALLRAYFIQDYEPYFYGAGARKHFAQQSYQMGLFPICAGPWIPKRLGIEGQTHISFNLSTELDRYIEANPGKEKRGICFYVRAHTERRGYELAVAVIYYLKKHRPDIEIATIGNSAAELDWLKGVRHYGNRPVSELPEIYSSYRVFGVFSFTNYSLLPAEIISCGTKVVDVDLENNQIVEGLFPKGFYYLAPAEVEAMAVKLAALHDENLKIDRENLLAWKKNFGGWDLQYSKVGKGLLEQFCR